MGRLKQHERLEIRSMGKLFPVTALFKSDAGANAYMATHRDEGVIAEVQGIIFIAAFHSAVPADQPEEQETVNGQG